MSAWQGSAVPDCYTPVTDIVDRRRLRSATQSRPRPSTVGRVVWNSLPDDLRAQQDYVFFKQDLKTRLSLGTIVRRDFRDKCTV